MIQQKDLNSALSNCNEKHQKDWSMMSVPTKLKKGRLDFAGETLIAGQVELHKKENFTGGSGCFLK